MKRLLQSFTTITTHTTGNVSQHDAVIRVYDEAGNVIEMHDHAGEFKKP